MKLEVYKEEEIDAVIAILESVQDNIYMNDENWDMLQLAISILAQEE